MVIIESDVVQSDGFQRKGVVIWAHEDLQPMVAQSGCLKNSLYEDMNFWAVFIGCWYFGYAMKVYDKKLADMSWH